MPLDSMVSAFVGVNVIPMDRDTVLVDQTVVVRNGRIEAIRARSAARLPASVRQVDGTGKWLMPGLADAHVHLVYLMNGKHNPLLWLTPFEALETATTNVARFLGQPNEFGVIKPGRAC